MHSPIASRSTVAKAAGLRTASVVKMEALITLPKRAILRRLGSLPKEAAREADEALAFSLELRLDSPAGR